MADEQPDVAKFDEIAAFITGGTPQSWILGYLRRFVPILTLDIAWETNVQPNRTTMKRRLKAVEQSASTLYHLLNDNSTVDYLGPNGLDEIKKIARFQADLSIVAGCARRAALSPDLSTATGLTRSGRGGARPRGTPTSHVHCALIIAEAWKCARGTYPAPRNGDARKAAAMLWKLSGGRWSGWSTDRVAGWRPHLTSAVSEKPSAALLQLRNEIRRHAVESSFEREQDGN